jgi:hypothetical protein
MDQTKSLRQQVYWLMIAVAAAVAGGRILSAERLYEPSKAVPPGAQNDGSYQVWPDKQPRPMPTFGSNDRSRWDTVRALVDEGTFVIGRRDLKHATAENPYGDYGIAFEDGWTTVDKVLNPEEKPDLLGKSTIEEDAEGEVRQFYPTLGQEYYSSKPPLLTVLMAGEYWVIKHVLGWSINEHPNEIVRIGLLTFNVLPLIFYLWMIARLAERYGATDWGRLFVVAAAAFGTLLTLFLITFNNHVPAAFAALAALYAALPVAFPDAPDDGPRAGRAGRLLAAGLAAGLLVNFELPAAAFVAALGLLLLIRAPVRTLLWFVPPVLLLVAAFFLLNHLATGQWTPVYEKIDTPWYQYPGSVWAGIHPGAGRGVEFAKYNESRGMYGFHLLFGHHGWFSLTPVNLLGAAGMVAALFGLLKRRTLGRAWDATTVGSFAVSLVVFIFYAFAVETANYGGWTNGPRWLLWLTPLWLFAMLPVADWLGRRRWGRVLCLVLLALSVLSASYSDWNPWRHPWLYNWMESNGWLSY